MTVLKLTAAARNKICALGGSLAMRLEPGGCCGTAYAFALEAGDDLHHYDLQGVGLALSAEALQVLQGATLDYGASLHPPRFRVLRNPNTPLRCACNRSFGLPFPGKCTPQCRAYCPMPWDKTETK